jgi:23S rRNA (guanosine2251-2'-O)-methyltransferase
VKARRKVVGLHAVESVLTGGPERIIQVWVDGGRSDKRLTRLLDAFAQAGIRVQEAPKHQLDTLSDRQNHQGIVLEYLAPDELNEDDLLEAVEQLDHPPFYLVLDHVQDPHNLGACMRSADAAGVDGVISTRDQSVGITPVVAKVASGAADTMPYYRVTNLSRTLNQLKERGVWVVGAAGEADKAYHQADFTGGLAIVMGAEGKGLRRLTRETCDFLVKIPMFGHVESLNVSVATGILLFEAARQRKNR